MIVGLLITGVVSSFMVLVNMFSFQLQKFYFNLSEHLHFSVTDMLSKFNCLDGYIYKSCFQQPSLKRENLKIKKIDYMYICFSFINILLTLM